MSSEAQTSRKLFSSNQYQTTILFTVLVSIIILLTPPVLLILKFQKELMHLSVQNPDIPSANVLNLWTLTTFVAIIMIFFLVLVWVGAVANQMVGAFARILTELDEIIDNKERRIIRVREGDVLANEVLKRINYLLQHVKWPL